jgi:branched-chain amino acid transport system permease protein
VGPQLLPEFAVDDPQLHRLYGLVAIGLALLTGDRRHELVRVTRRSSGGRRVRHRLSDDRFRAIAVDHAAGGVAASWAIAFVLGGLTLRLAGHYLPLGTIAWASASSSSPANLKSLGGHTGISNLPAISLLGFESRQRPSVQLSHLGRLDGRRGPDAEPLSSREGRAIRCL